MTSDLTPRQKSVLYFIVAFQRERHIAPTVREIGAHLGLSGPAGIHRILNILKDKGYILSEPGTIAAGCPTEATENWEAELAISPDLFGCESCFSLRVRGDSMIEAHIMDGDLAVIRPQPRVENGEIAAVLVQERLSEATLKIVRRTRSTLTLEPANAAYPALVFKGPQRKQVSILGRFVGIVRKV
jgi:repressor LexA